MNTQPKIAKRIAAEIAYQERRFPDLTDKERKEIAECIGYIERFKANMSGVGKENK